MPSILTHFVESSVESDSIAALPSQPGAASAQSQIKRHLVQHQPASNQPAPVAAKSAVDDLTTFVLDDDDFDGTMATIPKEAVQSPRISSASVPAPLSQSQRSHPNQLGVPPITHQQGNRPTNVVSQQTTAVYPNKTVCDINMSTTPTAPAEKPAPLTELQPTPPGRFNEMYNWVIIIMAKDGIGHVNKQLINIAIPACKLISCQKSCLYSLFPKRSHKL